MVSAGDVFRSKVDGLFEGIPGTYLVMDDLKVQGKTEVEHDINVLETCEVAFQNGNVWFK